jgi:alkanesulfonate monooxygenase SsuD/methylene tetrahydromethanopterin reductase-like flavin-dependent oxidoreductase (luciferase family)
VPVPLQTPRPPLTVGGQSPTVRRVAAATADCWNTHGPFGAGVEQILDITRRQQALVDDLCVQAGRDPSTLRRSLLLFGALDVWTSQVAFARIVEEFSAIGIREFVLFWPGDDRRAELERLAADVLDRVR